jgi:hypothetical protein
VANPPSKFLSFDIMPPVEDLAKIADLGAMIKFGASNTRAAAGSFCELCDEKGLVDCTAEAPRTRRGEFEMINLCTAIVEIVRKLR